MHKRNEQKDKRKALLDDTAGYHDQELKSVQIEYTQNFE